jgi:hypothetical protein
MSWDLEEPAALVSKQEEESALLTRLSRLTASMRVNNTSTDLQGHSAKDMCKITQHPFCHTDQVLQISPSPDTSYDVSKP